MDCIYLELCVPDDLYVSFQAVLKPRGRTTWAVEQAA